MPAHPILIRYHCPQADSVVWHWGVNDWQVLQPLPPGTVVEWGLMATPMVKKGDWFEARVSIPDGNIVDHGFSFFAHQGRAPWQSALRWYDLNNKPGKHNDRFLSDTTTHISTAPQPQWLRAEKNLGQWGFGLAWTLVSVLLFGLLRRKTNPANAGTLVKLCAAAMAAGWMVVGWRLYATGLFYPLLVFTTTAAKDYGAALQEDLLVWAWLSGGATILFFLLTTVVKFVNNQKPRKSLAEKPGTAGWTSPKANWLSSTLTLLLALFLLSNVLGHFFLENLGKPFNYAWLYYGDFLQSKDAQEAMKSQLGPAQFFLPLVVLGCFFLLKAGWQSFLCSSAKPAAKIFSCLLVPLGWAALYFGGASSPTPSATHIAAGAGASNTSLWVRPFSERNPLLFFVQSLRTAPLFTGASDNDKSPDNDRNSAASMAQWQKTAGLGPFADKSLKPLPPLLPSPPGPEQKPAIENIVVFVLESTPAHYLSIYNPKANATPFIQSLGQHGHWFQNIYAQAPATNKSLVSLLCANHPWLSFQSITKEKPKIAFTALPALLQQKGMATAFFNGGDLRFQNGDQFLLGRGFDTLVDQRNNPFATNRFNDPRYAAEHLGGVSDADVVKAFQQWHNALPAQQGFFALLWTFQTHYPYYTNRRPLKTFGSGNPSLEKYLNALSESDAALENLVNHLKASGRWKKTLLVVVGDHGEAFGEHNQTTHANGIYEENIHIPLGFIWGGATPPNSDRSKAPHPTNHQATVAQSGAPPTTALDPTPGALSDLAPSLLSLLGMAAPKDWQGQSLFQIERPLPVYFFSPFSENLYGTRTQNHKLIFNAGTGTVEYYDLQKDPKELRNTWDPNNAQAQKTLQSLQAWMLYQQQWMKGYLR